MRTCKIVDFAVTSNRSKIERKQNNYLDPTWEEKVTVEHEEDGDNNNWRSWKLEDEWGPSKLKYYWDWPVYIEESWRLEETCCHLNSCEKPSANAGVKKSRKGIS